MYNPFPFHDPKPVNRPELSQKTVESVVGGGNPVVAKRFIQAIAPKVEKEGAIVAFRDRVFLISIFAVFLSRVTLVGLIGPVNMGVPLP